MELSDEDSRLLSNRSDIETRLGGGGSGRGKVSKGALYLLTTFSSVLPAVCIPFHHYLSWHVQCLDVNKKRLSIPSR